MKKSDKQRVIKMITAPCDERMILKLKAKARAQDMSLAAFIRNTLIESNPELKKYQLYEYKNREGFSVKREIVRSLKLEIKPK